MPLSQFNLNRPKGKFAWGAATVPTPSCAGHFPTILGDGRRFDTTLSIDMIGVSLPYQAFAQSDLPAERYRIKSVLEQEFQRKPDTYPLSFF